MARQLTLDDAEFIAHAIAVELMNYDDEPIPPFDTRAPNILESCLGEPFQSFGGEEMHPTLTKKAAVLFYLVIKNHPFSNGNKRMAVVLTNVFFIVNGRTLDIPPRTLYDVACLVAESKPSEKDDLIATLDKNFKEYMLPTSQLRRILNKGE